MTDRKFPDPREEDIVYGDRRISRPDASLPDWEMPDTAYRPIPIVWFTGALVVQMVLLSAIFFLLASSHGAVTIAISALLTGAIGAWTWSRGMKDAGPIWRGATIAILALNLLLVCAGAYSRF